MARRAGLTLLEVLVSCAILSILSGYALSVHRGHVMRGYRLGAITALYRASLWLEQNWPPGPHSPGQSAGLPPGLDQAPPDGVAVYRLMAYVGPEAPGGYELEAVPEPAGPMANDRDCGTFVLDATGRRTNRLAADTAQRTQWLAGATYATTDRPGNKADARCWLGR
jgi:type IV pilus assembly protein PilE